jgi:hypothetical protein
MSLKLEIKTIMVGTILAFSGSNFSTLAASTQIFNTGDIFCPFFWVQASGDSIIKGFYGFAKVTDQQANNGLTNVNARFRIDRGVQWWINMVTNIDTTITLVFSDKKPDSVEICSEKFNTVPWLRSIVGGTDNNAYSIRFFFPILPQNQKYNQYDYYRLQINDTMDIQFQGVNDSVLAGSFVNRRLPGTVTKLYAKNAIMIQTTSTNSMRIRSIQMDSANAKFDSLYLNFDLLSLHKKAKMYGLNFIDTTIIEQTDSIIVSDVKFSGTQKLFIDSVYTLTWSLSNPGNVDRCSLAVSLDSEKTWKAANMSAGSATSIQWTAPSQESPHCFIKVIAIDKNGYKFSGLSAEFSIIKTDTVLQSHPPVNAYSLRGNALDSMAARLSWSCVAEQADTSVDSIAIRYDTLKFPTSMTDTNSRLLRVYGMTDSCDTANNLPKSEFYYFSFFVANAAGIWSTATSQSMALVHFYQSGDSNAVMAVVLGTDTVSFYYDSLKLWLSTNILVSYTDTIVLWAGPESKPGFIQMSSGFMLMKGNIPENTKVGVTLTYRKPPPAYSALNQRIYQYNIYTGKWHLNAGSVTVDTINHTIRTVLENARLPFIAMIDTAPPVLKHIGGNGETFSIQQTIIDTCLISDNIENLTIRLLAGPGHDEMADISAYIDTLEANSYYRVKIPDLKQECQNSGLRAYLAVSDSMFNRKLNLSKNIIRSANANCDNFVAAESTWTPIFVTARPDSATIASAILSDSAYNKKNERIIQWTPGSKNVDSDSNWLEYGKGIDSMFALAPGKLFWMKSRNQRSVHFGSAIVPALTDTVSIPLNTVGWTDFSNPFCFPLYCGDVIKATLKSAASPIDSSFGIYKWVKSGNSYYTEAVFLGGISSVGDSTDTLGSATPYSVYNPTSTSIVMRLPPEGTTLSQFNPNGVILKKPTHNEQWSVKIGMRYGDSAGLSPVYCASIPVSNAACWYPVSPSFAPIKTGVKNQQTKHIFGSTASGDLTKDGGCMFELPCKNSADRSIPVFIFIEKTSGLPYGTKAGLFPVGETTCLRDSIKFVLHSQMEKTTYLAVGDEEYIKQISKVFLRNLSLRIATHGHIMKLSYTVPFGTQSAEFSLYDIRGRVLWKNGISFGAMTTEGIVFIQKPFAVGFYVIVMKIKGQEESTNRILRQKVLYVR